MRLREERVRLEYTQVAFAAIGGVLVNAQYKYEIGRRSPNALYLSRLAEIGVDLVYVLTGRRSVLTDKVDGNATTQAAVPLIDEHR